MLTNTNSSGGTLQELTFTNRFYEELPGDPNPANSRRQVFNACYSGVLPTRVARPQLVAHSSEVADLLDLNEQTCRSPEFAAVFSGNQQLSGMKPFAMCYGGHQFGNWAGQLGDGRAINLGEIRNANGQHWTLQLKGAGPTPYSRTADGLAVLRSSVREFLCSEAMHHLGVPTTRALSLVLSGEEVMRDMFYDGNAAFEPGAIVCRVAESFTRFGNFQIFAARRDHQTLKQLVDFTIRSDFPHLGEPSPETYLAWFEEVCRTTAEMVAHWMRVGFVHGVMNTDNMSILGQTIDYGPYGWLDDFDTTWTPNTTDASGRRYRFGNQPTIAHWNLYQLANAILPVCSGPEPLEDILNQFPAHYEQTMHSIMAAKLGLKRFDAATDRDLLNDLFEVLQLVETDMTIFYRRLATVPLDDDTVGRSVDVAPLAETLQDAWYQPDQRTDEYMVRITDWLQRYRQRVHRDGTPDRVRAARMNATNPKYVLRNYMAQLAIDQSAEGNHQLIHDLLELLRHPYDEQPENEHFAVKRPDWARTKAGCSMLSCSS
ncbi:MAG: YdiU family protein [Planctomycetaceae bacterium]